MVWIKRAALILGMAAAGGACGFFAVAMLWNATQGTGAPVMPGVQGAVFGLRLFLGDVQGLAESEMPGVQGAVFGYLVGAPLGGAIGIVAGTIVAFRWIKKQSNP